MSVLPAEVHGALDQVLQALQNTDNTGCVAWDSCYGQNYSLDIAAA